MSWLGVLAINTSYSHVGRDASVISLAVVSSTDLFDTALVGVGIAEFV